MVTVTKKGFGFWKKTVVEHNGQTSEHSGNAEVEVNDNSTCITEKGVFTENSTCYLNSPEGDNPNGTSLPDGQLVGKSKNIVVENAEGERREYKSGILSIKSMEKHGEKVEVYENGLFGKKLVDTFDASEVGKIESEDCNVCKSTNPFYKD